MKVVFKLGYFCYPWHDDPMARTRELTKIINKVVSRYKIVPFCSHYAFDLLHGAMLDMEKTDPLKDIWPNLPPKEDDEWNRHVGIWDLAMISKCDVFIVCSPLDYKRSAGMCWEFCLASLLGKEILYWNGSELVKDDPWRW